MDGEVLKKPLTKPQRDLLVESTTARSYTGDPPGKVRPMAGFPSASVEYLRKTGRIARTPKRLPAERAALQEKAAGYILQAADLLRENPDKGWKEALALLILVDNTERDCAATMDVLTLDGWAELGLTPPPTGRLPESQDVVAQ